jgi:hypothetical protein
MNQSEHNLIGKRFGSLTVEGERQAMRRVAALRL